MSNRNNAGMVSNDVVVSICCLAYNHAPYIRECLEGFLMQRVNFPFEVLIHDDASTDGTADIIREYQEKYPDIIKPVIQEENQYSKGVRNISAKYNFSRVKGKYIAMCEGDDYWTDPLKLQKQVDFLESSPNISLVSAGYVTSEGEVNIFIKSNESSNFEFDINEWTRTWFTKTLTTLFRRESMKEYLEVTEQYKFGRDIHLFYHLLKRGNGIYLQESVGVYNIHDGGVCSLVDSKTNAMNTYNCWKELYSYNKDIVSQKMLFFSILKLLRTGHKTRYIAEGIKHIPNSVGYLRLFYSFIKGKVVKFDS